jgi:beta-glucosidase
MTDTFEFPKDFLWGAATAAYQIEGSPLADGAGASNWHRFAHTPGRIQAGDTGDVACDHYRLWADDVKLMRALGLKAYRFSLAWGRIFPEGRGRLNRAGLDFYLKLADALLAAGIEPFVTLHHWDLPAVLDDQGGWSHRDCAGWFADYAHAVFRAFEDRVGHWATLNEPWVITDLGYVQGLHAPGLRAFDRAPHVAHNLLRGHALAVQAFRSDGHGQIGLVVNLEPQEAASDHPDDRAATNLRHAYINRQYLDPVLLGSYPDELAKIYGAAWPRFPDDDLRLIREPIDFLGINYYSRSVVRHDPKAPPFHAARVRQDGAEHTEMDWEVYPAGLKSCLLWVRRRYGDIPLYVTENGAAFADPAPKAGRVEDPRRVEYLREHLRMAAAAIREGVDLRGYFAWSLLDNFEWAFGYSKRFGLYHVDYPTQTRTLKDSGEFYRRVIESRGAVLAAG